MKTLLLSVFTVGMLSVVPAFAQQTQILTGVPVMSTGNMVVPEVQEDQRTINTALLSLIAAKRAAIVSNGNRIVSKVQMGSSYNPYTLLVPESTCMTADQATGTILFTHRQCNTYAGGSGYIQSSFSHDGGTTFDSSLVIYTNSTNLGRYPSGVIYNPSGNTDWSQAYSAISGPTTNGSGWVGNFFGSRQLNGTNTNTQHIAYSDSAIGFLYEQYARNFMHVADDGKVRVYGDANTDDGAFYTSYKTIVNVGTFNSGTHSFDWSQFAHSPQYAVYNNLPSGYRTPGFASSVDGASMFLAYIGRDATAPDTLSYMPIVYKSVDGGATWAKEAAYDWTGSTPIVENLSGVMRPMFGLVKDAIVDGNGRLHIACFINSAASNHPDSLGYYLSYANIKGFAYDVFQTSTGWDAVIIDTIWTADVDDMNDPWMMGGWDERLQMSRTADGMKIFYAWMDTNYDLGLDMNLAPDVIARGRDVNTGYMTLSKNFTKGTFYESDNYYMYLSNISFRNGSEYTIPISTSQLGATDLSPAIHFFLKGATFLESEFLSDGFVANFASDATSICPGDSVSFTDLTSEFPDSWSWSFPGGTPSASTLQNPVVTYNSPGTYDVSLFASNATDSSSVTITGYISVAPLPDVQASAPVSICINSTTTLSASGANTYTWSPATGLSSTTGSSVVASPANTTIYTVTGVSGYCPVSDTVSVFIQPGPSLTTSPDTGYCESGYVILTANGAVSYSWTPAANLSSTVGSSVIANPSSTTTYTVTGVGSNGCTASKPITVTVGNPPSLITTGNATICEGNSTTIQVVGASTYSWAPSQGLSNTTGAIVIASPATNVVYSVTGTSAVGCSAVSEIVVSVNPKPTLATSGSDTICLGQSTQLLVTGASSYSWSPSVGLSITTGSTVSASPNSSTIYTVTGTSGYGCSSTTTLNVGVNPVPSVLVTTQTATCSGADGTALAIVAGGTGVYEYEWSSSPVQTTQQITGLTSGIYSVTVNDGNCSTVSSGVVQNTGAPVVSVSPDQANVCSGNSVVIQASGASTYTWAPAGVLSTTTGTSVTVSANSSVTVSVTGQESGCLGYAFSEIHVAPAPFVDLGNDIQACPNETVTLQAPAGYASYQWSVSGNTDPTIHLVSADLGAGPTSVSVTVTDSCGFTVSDEISITFSVLPEVSLPSDTFLCQGNVMILSPGGNFQEYLWSTGDTTQLFEFDATQAGQGSHTISVTVTDNCGIEAMGQIVIGVDSIPSINLDGDTAICEGGSLTLDAGSGFLTYNWSTGGSSRFEVVDESNLLPGSNTVSLTVTDACSNTATNSTNIDLVSLPVADFSYMLHNDSVLFTNSSSNADFSVWTFGDGGTYSGVGNPWHGYSASGQYDVVMIAINACGSDTTEQTVDVNITSVFDRSSEVLVVFPNPTEGKVWIDFPEQLTDVLEVRILNPLGQIVYSETLNNPAQQTLMIDIRKQPSGVYSLLIVSGNSVKAIPLILSK
ncbi:MAG: T9SS type A sorting domain-containing protein [Bacteroidetes bacterium]|nr:T9SS type A sorting domain-containing protein [Bacteroidota bacterium]